MGTKQVRGIASALALLVIGIGILGWGGWNYVASTTGEKTTAVVDQCTKTYGRKGRTRTTCQGSWQLGGVTQRGRIEGVGDDDEGKAVEVRIHDGEAYAFSWAGVLVPAVIGGGLLIGGVLWVASVFRGGKTPPTAPAWQGGPPPNPQHPYAQRPHAAYPPQQAYAAPPGQYWPAQYPPGQYPLPGHPQPGQAQPGYAPPPGQYPPGAPAGAYPPPGYPPAPYPPVQYPPVQYPPPAYPPR